MKPNRPSSQKLANRTHQLRKRGLTWEQIADVWQSDHPEISPRVTFRWAHNLTLPEVVARWNMHDPGEPTMTKGRLHNFEQWPASHHGRRPSAAALTMLARIYQTTGRRLLTEEEYALYDASSRALINGIDYRHLDCAQPRLSVDDADPPSRNESASSSDFARYAAVVSGTAGPQRAEPAATLEEILTHWNELMQRRDLFTIAGATAVATILPDLPNMNPLPPAFGNAELYKTYAELTRSYRALDNLLGPHTVYGQAADHHQRLTSWLQQARSTQDRKDLAELASDAGDLLAWICFDLEQYTQAASLYQQAAKFAQIRDDVSRQAYLVGRMSRTLSECKQHDHALKFANEAVRLAGSKAVPSVRSWLMATRAYVHASIGNERECRSDLDASAALLDRIDQAEAKPDYISFYGTDHLHKWIGHSLLKLGKRKPTTINEGRHAIDQAFDIWSHAAVRASAEVLTARAAARLAQREIPEAARLTAQAYAIATQTQSPRNMRHVWDLRRRLRPYRDTEAVRELDEQFGL